MKIKLIYLFAITTALISVSFASCGSDNDDDSTIQTNNNITNTNNNNNVEAIDLGLTVKWASSNMQGLYQWGMIEPGHRDYPYTGGSGYTFVDIGSNISGTEYDAAHIKWGNKWRMPTAEELWELCHNCITENGVENGIKGKRFIGKNGNSIFLPYNGYHSSSSLLHDKGSKGYYWSSIPYEPTWGYAYYASIDDGGCNVFKSYNKGKPNDFPHRYYCFSIRPVMDKEITGTGH